MTLRWLARTDLFYLLRYLLNRPDIENPWILARCKEVQEKPNGYLDLWSREHYKSTIITFAKTIQDILASHGDDPLPEWKGREVTCAIFSHSRPASKAFLKQIKRELEVNLTLRALFPDILYDDPGRESPGWSEDAGLIVKRRSNPKEATLEAWGLIDAMPTGGHWMLRIYDDLVTVNNAKSPEMQAKTLEAWELSLNLGTVDGLARYAGTRYHYSDAYGTILKRGSAIPRIYTATENGEFDGEPVLWTREHLEKRIRDLGPYNAACQLFLNPALDEMQSLKKEWLQFHEATRANNMNVYILVDPAGEKKKTSDRTAMVVMGLGGDKNYYVMDMIWDRLNLAERVQALFHLCRKWRPRWVGYEKYGMQSDIAHIKHVQEEQNFRFQIIELGGRLGNLDRIRRLVPVLSQNKFYVPKQLYKQLSDGTTVDLIEKWINEEYSAFPMAHCDALDAMSRILDEGINTTWPDYVPDRRERYASSYGKKRRQHTSWLTR